MNEKFSVLICTYNRPELLAHCLKALILSTDEKPDQVVVVNSGDARTDTIVRSFQDTSVHVKLIRTANKNLATSRNMGLQYCVSDLIAMTDDDAEVFPNWVTQMKRAHRDHPEAGAVGGSVIGAEPEPLVARIADRVTFPSYSSARAVRSLPGVNISYKRYVVEQVGFQDESLFRGEDVDYNWRVLKLGFSIFYDPLIRVYHHHRPTMRAFLNQHYMYGRAYYRVRRKWPEMYSVYPHRLKGPKDILKGINFVAATFYEPLIFARRMDQFADKLMSYPLLLLATLGWKTGMIYQGWLTHQEQHSHEIASRRY